MYILILFRWLFKSMPYNLKKSKFSYSLHLNSALIILVQWNHGEIHDFLNTMNIIQTLTGSTVGCITPRSNMTLKARLMKTSLLRQSKYVLENNWPILMVHVIYLMAAWYSNDNHICKVSWSQHTVDTEAWMVCRGGHLFKYFKY